MTLRLVCLLAFATAPVVARAEIAASTSAPLVAGEPGTRVIEVRGLPGAGEPRADVNVGAVERIEVAGDRTLVHYRLPEKPFPQQLCLLLWRKAEGKAARVHATRLPILARTTIPVQTRRNSKVTIRVGSQSFGPLDTGARGRIRAEVLVPPAIREALVAVVDEAGLRSQKRIAIQTPAFNELAMALLADDRPGLPSFRLEVVAASPSSRAPLLQVGAESAPLERAGEGRWRAHWAPATRPPEGLLPIRVWLPGQPESQRFAQLQIAPGRLTVEVLKVRPAVLPPPPHRRAGLRADLGIAVGLMHNLGTLLAPRVSAELGLDFPLPFGRLGLRLVASFARGSQQIPSGRTDLPDAEATVILLPFGGGLSYRMTSLPLSPFVFAGLLAQLVRSSTSADYMPERLRHDWTIGVVGLAGIEPRLGPGRIVLQTGYQWSQVENPDLVLLGGGIVVEGGYRLEL